MCVKIFLHNHTGLMQGQWLFLMLANKQMSRTSTHLSKFLSLETFQGESFFRLKRAKGIYISQDVLMWLFSGYKNAEKLEENCI